MSPPLHPSPKSCALVSSVLAPGLDWYETRQNRPHEGQMPAHMTAQLHCGPQPYTWWAPWYPHGLVPKAARSRTGGSVLRACLRSMGSRRHWEGCRTGATLHSVPAPPGHYVHFDTRMLGAGGTTAQLVSQHLPATADSCLRFWYHMDIPEHLCKCCPSRLSRRCCPRRGWLQPVGG